jgi:hypothetical protein
MKTMIFAAAAVVALGLGSAAYAGEGDGENTATAQFLQMSGVNQEPADQFVARPVTAAQAQHAQANQSTNAPIFPIPAGNG